jgi:hypothetical protein
MALEEAGELQEAARVFEYAGEHAQAALLRLEHARTLRDAGERLDVLREGCARNPGTTVEGRLLHKALAESLLDEADAVGSGAQRRALELEAAAALEEADEGGRAGELYESLRLLHKAAAAYERAGEIAKLELVLEVLDRHEEQAKQRRDLVQEIDTAITQGQRRYALSLLHEHVHGGSVGAETRALQRAETAVVGSVRPPAVPLVSRLQLLESKLLTRDRIDFDWGSGRVTRIRMGDRFALGRAPDADLSLSGANLSRRHVELRVTGFGDRPQLCAVDLGSKIGSFWNGEPLAPGEPVPLEEPGELACGLTAPVLVHPVRERTGTAVGGLLCVPGTSTWMLFVPGGGPLWLSPEIRVPARVFPDRGFVVLDLAARVEAKLGDEPLPPGANIELMLGDRLSLVAAPLCLEVLG